MSPRSPVTMILGGRVMVAEVESSFLGQHFTAMAWSGYDNVRGKYWNPLTGGRVENRTVIVNSGDRQVMEIVYTRK